MNGKIIKIKQIAIWQAYKLSMLRIHSALSQSTHKERISSTSPFFGGGRCRRSCFHIEKRRLSNIRVSIGIETLFAGLAVKRYRDSNGTSFHNTSAAFLRNSSRESWLNCGILMPNAPEIRQQLK
jgi:hypothetical protein